LIFDFKRKNFKSTIFIKNPINPPLGFCPHAQTFRCAIPTQPIGVPKTPYNPCFLSFYSLCKTAHFLSLSLSFLLQQSSARVWVTFFVELVNFISISHQLALNSYSFFSSLIFVIPTRVHRSNPYLFWY